MKEFGFEIENQERNWQSGWIREPFPPRRRRGRHLCWTSNTISAFKLQKDGEVFYQNLCYSSKERRRKNWMEQLKAKNMMKWCANLTVLCNDRDGIK